MKLNWCILRTKENSKQINEWFNTNAFKPKRFNELGEPLDTGIAGDTPILLHFPAFKGAHIRSKRASGYIQIRLK